MAVITLDGSPQVLLPPPAFLQQNPDDLIQQVDHLQFWPQAEVVAEIETSVTIFPTEGQQTSFPTSP